MAGLGDFLLEQDSLFWSHLRSEFLRPGRRLLKGEVHCFFSDRPGRTNNASGSFFFDGATVPTIDYQGSRFEVTCLHWERGLGVPAAFDPPKYEIN